MSLSCHCHVTENMLTTPLLEPEAVPEWKKILERHKSERAQDDKNSEQVKELWNKYVKVKPIYKLKPIRKHFLISRLSHNIFLE